MLPLTSLSFSERDFFFSQIRVSLLNLHLGGINLSGDNALWCVT